MGYKAGDVKLEADKIIQKKEFKSLLASARKLGLDCYFLILFGGNLGVRSGEAVLLRPSDFRLEEGLVTVPTLKKRAAEPPRLSVYVPKSFCSRMVELFAEIPSGWKPHDRIIPRSTRWVRFRWQEIKTLAGIRRPVGYHSLRHYFGTKCYQATKDLVFTQMQMRHTSLSTVQRYQHLVDAREKAELVGELDNELP
jgi:integrase